MAPFRGDLEDESPYTKVLACAYTHDKGTPSFFSFLDGNGEVVDFLRLDNLAKRKYTTYDREREEKEEDLAKLKEFVRKHGPNAIVLSAETRDSLSLAEEIREVVGELSQEEDFSAIPVELLDPNLAYIFSKSRNGRVCGDGAMGVALTKWVWLQ